jgi:hypothetical protein
MLIFLSLAPAALASEDKGDLLPAALYGRISPSVVVVESTLKQGVSQG